MKTNRRAKPLRVGEILVGHVDPLFRDRGLPATIVTSWRKAVGTAVSTRALPWRRRGRTLFVRVATSPWLQELKMLTPQVLEKLRREPGCGEIEDLRFEVGRVQSDPLSPEEPPELPLEPAAVEAWPEKVREAVDALGDDTLRGQVRRTVAICLARKGSSSGGDPAA